MTNKEHELFKAAKRLVLDDETSQTVMRMISHYRPRGVEDFDFSERWGALIKATLDVVNDELPLPDAKAADEVMKGRT